MPVEGVNILLSESQASFITNYNGNFEILLPSESYHEIIFSRIGYKSFRLSSESIRRSPYLEIRLMPTEITLGEVTVTSTKYSKLEKEVALPLEVVSTEKLERNLSISCSGYS
ncbi:MAG: carboxypeptidase-like regulatory domain-containing protein [Ignavibacteriales bacterium]|nr:carboxypeptidase-like regulatory domain-containing protein [Ignavibacteriales bacterium]